MRKNYGKTDAIAMLFVYLTGPREDYYINRGIPAVRYTRQRPPLRNSAAALPVA